MGRVFICGDHGPLVVPARDCPNVANHQPHPTDYVANSAWAEAAAHVATQDAPCPGCGLWHIWTPKHADVRIAAVWPVPDCLWSECGAEGVGERQLAGGVWVPVCADHTGVPS